MTAPRTSDSPPPYSFRSGTYTLHSGSDTLSLASTSVLPQRGEPGFASENLLERGLQVPSQSDLITSGFVYPDILANYDVSREKWRLFTQDVMEGARLSRDQWTTSVGKGLGVMAVGGLMVGVLGAIPAVLVARRMQRNREEQNMIKATAADESQESSLSWKINHWNETYFNRRRILIRVDLPFEDLDEMQSMDISTSQDFHRVNSSGPGKPAWRSRTKDDKSAREDASRRARIVVIPLETGPENVKS